MTPSDRRTQQLCDEKQLARWPGIVASCDQQNSTAVTVFFLALAKASGPRQRLIEDEAIAPKAQPIAERRGLYRPMFQCDGGGAASIGFADVVDPHLRGSRQNITIKAHGPSAQ